MSNSAEPFRQEDVALDHDAQRIAVLQELRSADRMSAVGKLASGIAHELGTPLNVVSGRAAMIASGDLSPEDCVRNAGIIIEQVNRLVQIIRQMLEFSRKSRPNLQDADMVQLMRQACDLVQPLAQLRSINIQLHAAPAWPLQVDPHKILQVFTILLMNAIDDATGQGVVDIRLEQCQVARPPPHAHFAPNYLCITMNNGKTISPEVVRDLSEPFFLATHTAESIGLGFAVCQGIMREHGGWFDIDSDLERSSLRLYLPLGG